MAIKITKNAKAVVEKPLPQKQVTKTVEKPPQQLPPVESTGVKEDEIDVDALAVLVDAYGDAKTALDEAKKNPAYAKFDMASKALWDVLGTLEPTLEIAVPCEKYLVEIGKCSRKPSSIKDMAQVRAILGEKVFMELVSVPLGDLNKYLTPEQLAIVLETDTGYGTARKINVKPIA